MSSADYFDRLTLDQIVVDPISTLSAMYFFYGFYALLFGTCIYMMSSRSRDQEGNNHKLYLSSTIALFALSSIFVAAYTVDRVQHSVIFFIALTTRDSVLLGNYVERDTEKTVAYAFEVLIGVFLNIIADVILIHRCCLIWNSKKRVAVPLIIWSVITSIAGFIGNSMMIVNISNSSTDAHQVLFLLGNLIAFAYSISSVVLNTVITLLTAGRIWWIYRELRALGTHTGDSIVQSISRIILESGILYPFVTIVGTIAVNVGPQCAFIPFDFAPLSILAAGIAPTLIMVRARMGKGIERDMTVSEMRFTSNQLVPREGELQVQTQSYHLGNRLVDSEEGYEHEGRKEV